MHMTTPRLRNVHHASTALARLCHTRRRRSNPRATKPARAPHALLQLGDLDDLRRIDTLEHQLRDAIVQGDGKVRGRVVEQEHFDLAAVIGVDDAGARVDVVFRGEA